jgi:antitoxin component HigA of HigAB toxin-antitoxin module
MDEARYGQLLAEIRPALIESPAEHDRMLTAAETLMEKGSALTPEEQRVLELLVFLIKSFEDSVLAEEAADDDEDEPEPVNALPHETLKRLLEARGLAPSDIQHVFGNPAACREALAGTRKITRGQARDLGKAFQVPYKLFLD